MKNRQAIVSVLLFLASLILLVSGCNTNEIVSPAVDESSAVITVEDLYGTWRQTDGSLFILINETKIAFFEPNELLDEFYNYEFDGEILSVYLPEEVALLKVELTGNLMTLTEVSGMGHMGVFQRTGSF